MTDVLIIETDSILLDLMQLGLARRGLRVVGAENGADAMAAYLQHAPRLVLLDLFLPQTNVLDMIRRMKKRAPATSILLLSSFGFPEVVQQAMAAGAQDYLLKPVNMDMLAERVEKALAALPQVKDIPPAEIPARQEKLPDHKNSDDEMLKGRKEISKPVFRQVRRKG